MATAQQHEVTRLELATRLRCNPRTIAKWLEEGLPVARRGRGGRPSRYDEVAVRAWLRAREDAGHGDHPVDLVRERARRERAQALLAEQTHAVRAGTLLQADHVERLWSAEVAAVRAAILATYTTVADRLHRAAILDGVAGVEAELKIIAYDLLRALADTDRPVLCPHCQADLRAPVAPSGTAQPSLTTDGGMHGKTEIFAPARELDISGHI